MKVESGTWHIVPFKQCGSPNFGQLVACETNMQWMVAHRRKRLEVSHSFLGGQRGAAATEYSAMLALLLCFCISSISSLGQTANNSFLAVAPQDSFALLVSSTSNDMVPQLGEGPLYGGGSETTNPTGTTFCPDEIECISSGSGSGNPTTNSVPAGEIGGTSGPAQVAQLIW